MILYDMIDGWVFDIRCAVGSEVRGRVHRNWPGWVFCDEFAVINCRSVVRDIRNKEMNDPRAAQPLFHLTDNLRYSSPSLT